MAGKVNCALLLMAICVTLIQAQRKNVPVVSGSVPQTSPSWAAGDSAWAAGDSAWAAGDSAWAAGDSAWAGGDSAWAGGDSAWAGGDSAWAGGDSAWAGGDSAWAGGDSAWAGGDSAWAGGDSAWAGGDSTWAGGDSAWAASDKDYTWGGSSNDYDYTWGGGNNDYDYTWGGGNNDYDYTWGGSDNDYPWEGGHNDYSWGGSNTLWDNTYSNSFDAGNAFENDAEHTSGGSIQYSSGEEYPFGGAAPFPSGDEYPFEGAAKYPSGDEYPFGGAAQYPSNEYPFGGAAPYPSGDEYPFEGAAPYPSGDEYHFEGAAKYPSGDGYPFEGAAKYPSGDEYPFEGAAKYPSGDEYPFGGDAQYPSGDEYPFGGDTQYPSGDEYPFGGDTQYPSGDEYPFGGDAQYPLDDKYPSGGTANYPSDDKYPTGVAPNYPSNDKYPSAAAVNYPSDDEYVSGDYTDYPSNGAVHYPPGGDAQKGEDSQNIIGNLNTQGSNTDIFNSDPNIYGDDSDSVIGSSFENLFGYDDQYAFEGDHQNPFGSNNEAFGFPSSHQEPSGLGQDSYTNTPSNQYFALEDLIIEPIVYSSQKVPKFLKHLKPLAVGVPLPEREESENQEYHEYKDVQDYFSLEETYESHKTVNRKMDRKPVEEMVLPDMPLAEGQEYNHGGHDDMPDMVMKHMGFEVMNPSEVKDGELLQMDMILTPQQKQVVMDDMATNGTTARKAISDTRYHWPEGPDGFPVVPYVFGDNLINRDKIRQAMQEWTAHTCVRFEETRNLKNPHLIFIGGTGCYSYIGRIWFYMGQHVSLGKFCDLQAAIHEIGHSLGLYHEQSRPDRDSYIRVNIENLKNAKNFNFHKAKVYRVNNRGVPYDYASIMHYKAKTYYNGGLVLSTLNPLYQELVGNMGKLSHRDKLLVNRVYNCIGKWLHLCGLESEPCQNHGFTGADCNCVCSPGTSGTHCEIVTAGYYDSYMSGCSEKVEEETTLTSERFPQHIPEGTKCTKWIIPPPCHSVELTFAYFNMYPRINCQNRESCCYWDGLEIRTDNNYIGNWYCGRDIHYGRKFLSTTSMILYYHTTSKYSRGWRAIVRFLPTEGCTDQVYARTGKKNDKIPLKSPEIHLRTMTVLSHNTIFSKKPPSRKTNTCGLQEEYGSIHWTSPFYKMQKYPPNFSCYFTTIAKFPAPLELTFNYFNIQPRLRGMCLDSITLTEPFEEETRFCEMNAKILLPASSLMAKFTSDGKYNYNGFNMTFTTLNNSPCHKIVRIVNEEGRITTPDYPKHHGKGCICEWWIIAPPKRKINILIRGSKIKNCYDNYLVVDLNGSKAYHRSTSVRFCNKNNLPATLESTGNELNIVYKSMKNSKGFEIVYKLV